MGLYPSPRLTTRTTKPQLAELPGDEFGPPHTTEQEENSMRWGLSWGAQAPHHVEVAGTRYEVRTTKIAGLWTAYGTVGGACVEATGSSEREARQKWQQTVAALAPQLAVERRMEQALDEAAAALEGVISDIATAETLAARSMTAQSLTAQSDTAQSNTAQSLSADVPHGPAPADPASTAPPLYPETCENPRSVDRRLRPRLRREQ